jgi:hypothetical protein
MSQPQQESTGKPKETARHANMPGGIPEVVTLLRELLLLAY